MLNKINQAIENISCEEELDLFGKWLNQALRNRVIGQDSYNRFLEQAKGKVKQDVFKVELDNVEINRQEIKEDTEENIDYTEYTDLELIKDGAFIPFKPYYFTVRFPTKNKNKNMTKNMFKIYYALCYYAKNKNGLVQGVSTNDISDFVKIGQNEVVEAAKRLSQLNLIEIIDNELINQYKIVGYEEALMKSGKGGFVISLDLFKRLIGCKLKHYRLVWYLCSLRHHMPNNEGKTGIKQGTLLSITNCVSIKELKSIIKDLTGTILNTVCNFLNKVKRSLMKSKKLFFEFKLLGIDVNKVTESDKKKIEQHRLKEDTEKILHNLKIVPNWKNLKIALDKIDNTAEYLFLEVKRMSKERFFNSKYNTINYFLAMIDNIANNLK